MTLAVSFIIGRPSDKKHPWGHQRAETMASLILAFIIMIAGFQLFITATGKLINVYKGTVTILMPHIFAVIVTVSSIARVQPRFASSLRLSTFPQSACQISGINYPLSFSFDLSCEVSKHQDRQHEIG